MKEKQTENDTTGIGKKNDTGKVQVLDGKGIEKLEELRPCKVREEKEGIIKRSAHIS